MKVKICGLSGTEDIDYVNDAKPDMVGFVLAKSKRQVSDEELRTLKEKLHPAIKAVGVFVNECPQQIIRLLREDVIDLAQLHGEESEEEILQIQGETGKQVIKAFQITPQTDLARIFKAIMDSPADYVLLDSGKGTGKPFDWTCLAQCNRPFFLAGGLNAENLQEAMEQCHPMGIDISSGVETNGQKDYQKIREITARIKENNKKGSTKNE